VKNLLGILTLCGAGIFLLPGCSALNAVDGGGGIETVAVAGKVVSSQGTPVVNAVVSLRRSDFLTNPGFPQLAKIRRTIVNTATDSTGAFFIDSVDLGSYSIEVNDRSGNGLLLQATAGEADQDVNLPTDTIRPVGAIEGVVDMRQQEQTEIVVQVKGLDRRAVVDAMTGKYSIADVPAGQYEIHVVTAPTVIRPAIRSDIAVASGASTTVDTIRLPVFSGWAHSGRLTLNTTAAGAGVLGNVAGFPLLVRLSKANFDFRQALAKGADVRFTKPDATPLPFEIEQWDSAGGQAAVWVRLDTVYGDNSAQYLNMYWGNRAAADSSNPAAVFDTTNGYAGVWHLNRDCADATANGHDGTSFGATDAAGIIGYAKRFDGTDSIRIAGLLNSPASITLSAWASLNGSSTGGSDVISLGDAVLLRMDDHFVPAGVMGSYKNDTLDRYSSAESNQFLTQTGWHFLTYAIDTITQQQALYIYGLPVVLNYLKSPIVYQGTAMGQNTFIGAHGTGKPEFIFNGSIDEVRVCRMAQTADWVKLCYMNQKPSDALVKLSRN
jgi:hypothetical protein